MCRCLSTQSFLKSEVSEENILFWQACEKFRMIPVSSVDKVCEQLLVVYKLFTVVYILLCLFLCMNGGYCSCNSYYLLYVTLIGILVKPKVKVTK